MDSGGDELEAPLVDLVGQIYASAMEPHMTGQVLALVNQQLEAACTRLVVRHTSTQEVLQSCAAGAGTGVAGHDDYVAQWSKEDPLAGRISTHAPGDVLRCHEHFDEEFVASSPFFQDHLLAHGLRWTMCGLVDSTSETVSILASLRGVDAAPFDGRAAATLRLLMPHFRRTARLRMNLQQAPQAGAGNLDLLRALPTPWMLTDHAGRCIEANAALQSLAASLDFRLVLGRLRFGLADTQARWERALFETHGTALGRAVTLTGAANAAEGWCAHLIPWQGLSRDTDGAGAKLIIALFERVAATPVPDARLLELKARLTRAELEVFGALLQGSSAKTIARQRGASFNTIRSQIMRILGKTGHHSQRELIASFGVSSLPDSVLDSDSD